MDHGVHIQAMILHFEAMIFVGRVRRRLSVKDPKRYRHFLQIFQLFQHDQLVANEVREQMFQVLAGELDLLQEFIHFLPPHAQVDAQVQLDAMARDQ